jgi:hypothetical protein
MVQHKPKACKFCGCMFTPHYKVGARQIACSKRECQCARNGANLQKLYDSDPGYNYDNVKRYRARHPNYQKQRRQKLKEAALASEVSQMRSSQQQHQRIPASLFVSSGTSEIQSELSSVKTVRPRTRGRPPREIQTELTLSFSVQLDKLLPSLRRVRYKSS